MTEVTITKLTKGYLITYIDGMHYAREAELSESDAMRRIKELLNEETDDD